MALFGGKNKKEKEVKEVKPTSKDSDYVDPATGQVIGKPATKKGSSKKLKKDTGFAYKTLIRPVVSEKATDLTTDNKYVFEVRKGINKRTVELAVEKVYDTKVKSVNVMNVKGKERKVGRTIGRTPDRRKAIVTLEEGEKIEVFEGV